MSTDALHHLYAENPPQETSLPKLLSPKELASYLRKSHAWIERSRWDGTGPKFIKVGHHCFYREQDVIEWLSERQRSQTGTAK